MDTDPESALEKSKLTMCVYELMLNVRMAMMEIRLLLSALLMKYESWSGVPDKPGKWDEEMKPQDSIVLLPRNGKCVLRFKSRD